MIIYGILPVLSVILGILLVNKNPSKTRKIIYLSVMFSLMWLVATFRYGVGNDYFSYIRIFNEINITSWDKIFTLKYEPAFTLLTKAMSYLTCNPEIMYGIYAILILVPIAYVIYRHSDNIWLSVTIYLCLTFYYTSLSFIRQSLAVSLLILCYGFIKTRKIIPVIILAVLASLFHYTAIVFIPFCLLAFFIKPTKKTIIIYSTVSIGLLIVCLILKNTDINPVNILAKIATSITGKDYIGYIDSKWFENGLDFRYIIMPVVLAIIMLLCYFLGWKNKDESHVLLWFMLINTSIWSFITYAFIIERFSMFIFIFSIIAIPSAFSYFKEKSKKTSDNIYVVSVFTIIGLFAYNYWGMNMNFHGIIPYTVNIPVIQDKIDNLNTTEENIDALRTNADLYTYLIQLKNINCPYIVISTADCYDGLIPGIEKAFDYADIGLNNFDKTNPHYFEYNNRTDEHFSERFDTNTIRYVSKNNIVIQCNDKTGFVIDNNDIIARINENELVFILLDSRGVITDATTFKIDRPQRTAVKTTLEKRY